MADTKASRSIESLLEAGMWEAARAKIERELLERPDDHWLRTQLGVTFYEQGRYQDSLRPLLESLKIVPDCPLTLWNLAGALDALGKSDRALPVYTWLLKSAKTAEDDPCWESAEWTDSLKTDCVYRLGICFRNLGIRNSAENCFRQYINLLLAGMIGTYSVEQAASQIRGAFGSEERKPRDKKIWDAFGSTLRDSGLRPFATAPGDLPELSGVERFAL